MKGWVLKSITTNEYFNGINDTYGKLNKATIYSTVKVAFEIGDTNDSIVQINIEETGDSTYLIEEGTNEKTSKKT